MIVDEILVSLGFEMDESGGEDLKKFKSGLGTALGMLAKGAAVAAGFATAVAGIAVAVSKTTAELANTAAQLGESVTKIDAMAGAFDLAAGMGEKVVPALMSIQSAASQAWETGGAFAETMGRLGVQTHNAAGKLRPSSEILYDIADGLAKVKDRSTRIKLAQDAGVLDMLPQLEKGSKYLREMERQASNLSLVTPEQAKLAQEFMGNIRTLHRFVSGLVQVFVSELSPGLSDIMKTFSDWMAVNKEWIKLNIAKAAQAIVNVFKLMVWGFMKAADAVKWLTDLFGGMGSVFYILTAAWGVFMAFWTVRAAQMGIGLLKNLGILGRLGSAFRMIMTAARAMWAAVTGPVGLAVAAIASVILLLQDVWVYLHGGDSMIGRMLQKFDYFRTVWNLIGDTIAGVILIVMDFVRAMSDPFNSESWKNLGNTIMSVFSNTFSLFRSMVVKQINFLIGMLNKLPGINITPLVDVGAAAGTVVKVVKTAAASSEVTGAMKATSEVAKKAVTIGALPVAQQIASVGPAAVSAASGASSAKAAQADRFASSDVSAAKSAQYAQNGPKSINHDITINFSGDSSGIDQAKMREAITKTIGEKTRQAMIDMNTGVIA